MFRVELLIEFGGVFQSEVSGQAVEQNTPIVAQSGGFTSTTEKMTQQLKGFNTYEDYLDSQLVDEDLYYLKVSV